MHIQDRLMNINDNTFKSYSFIRLVGVFRKWQKTRFFQVAIFIHVNCECRIKMSVCCSELMQNIMV